MHPNFLLLPQLSKCIIAVHPVLVNTSNSNPEMLPWKCYPRISQGITNVWDSKYLYKIHEVVFEKVVFWAKVVDRLTATQSYSATMARNSHSFLMSSLSGNLHEKVAVKVSPFNDLLSVNPGLFPSLSFPSQYFFTLST